MALVDGVSCGFVTTAPVDDPSPGGTSTFDGYSGATKFTSPADMDSIISMGAWIVDGGTATGNVQFGIYSHDAANDRPGTLLGSSGDISKDTTDNRWLSATFTVSGLSGNTIYWLAMQADTVTGSVLAGSETNTYKSDYRGPGETELPGTWGVSDGTAGRMRGIYAVYTAAAGGAVLTGYLSTMKGIW